MTNEHITDEREAAKVSLCVLCAVLDANEWHPNMRKDIQFAIDANRAALRPAAQPVGEPIKPFFAVSIASRKWAELQEQGHRMQNVAFDGGPGGAGVIDPWGKVTWGKPSPERVPMTAAQECELVVNHRYDLTPANRRSAFVDGIRAAEAHYGITTPKADK